MARALLQNGRLVCIEHEGIQTLWEPTTEMVCSFCREPFPLHRETVNKVNFTYDYGSPDPLEQGAYWYLHKRCAYIDRVLERRWPWLSMWSVLGRGFMGKERRSTIQKELQRRMPPGCYDYLYAQWLPALRPLQSSTPQPGPTMRQEPVPQIVQPTMPQSVTLPSVRRQSWRALRFSILQRDGFRCLLCGVSAKDDPDTRLEVDHIISRARGGTNDPSNLWTLCFDCNRGKGVQEL